MSIKVVNVFDYPNSIGYKVVDLSLPGALVGSSDDYHLIEGERLLSFNFHKDSFRKLMGKTLTVLDASIPEPKQNKAIKDLIRGIFSEELSFSSEMAYDQNVFQSSLPDDYPSEEITEVEIETVLGVKQ